MIRPRMHMPSIRHAKRRQANAHGFTLIEVLVALAVVSIALMSGLKVSGALTRNAQRQTDVMLAQICADNALNQLRLSQQLPSVGDSRVTCAQVDRNFDVALTVRTTPNPAFRRVDAQVFDAATPVLNITTVLGRY